MIKLTLVIVVWIVLALSLLYLDIISALAMVDQALDVITGDEVVE